jgi:hypothetical protein
MNNWKNREEEVKNNCHLSVKAEEDRKEAKEAAALFNALIVEHKYREIRQRGTPAVFRLLSLS